MSTIVVVGSLNMDLVVQTPRFPGPGETIAGYDFHTIPGGKGANQAVAAARQGSDVSMVGRVGDDAFGQRLRESLRRDRVDTRYITIDQEAATGVAIIAVDESGENRIIIAPGANGRLCPEDMEAATADIALADVLLLQLEVPLPTVQRAVEAARSNGARVILNPAPAQPLSAELLAQVDFLIPNETEAALLANGDTGSPEASARALRDQGVEAVIVTLGARGAMLVNGQGAEVMDAFPVTVVDTTAAGDAFAGAFAVALAEGKSTPEAVRWANAAGALATTKFGAQPSLPTYAAVAEFINANGEARA